MEKTEFIERLEAAKNSLPIGVVPLFLRRYPEYDTYKKRSRVQNTMSGRIYDEEILELLEDLAELITSNH